MTHDVPMIWTTKGHLPICECEQYVMWTITDESITFALIVRHQGEEVKRDVHVYMKRGLPTEAEPGSFEGTPS